MAISRRKANPKGRPVYIIETRDGGGYSGVPARGRWTDSGEGPWKTLYEATRFAEAEVGVEWRVVALYGKSKAFIDRNEPRPGHLRL
jgi:hypothetical protein